MSTNVIFLSLKKQCQITELWNNLLEQNTITESHDFSIIKNVIEKIPENCGVDFLYMNITIENLEKLLISGGNYDYNKLSGLLFSALANSHTELETAALHWEKHTKTTEHYLAPSCYQTNDICNQSAISFVVYATIARNIAYVCEKDWGTGSAALVAECLGFLARIPKFNANMDMILSCIFDTDDRYYPCPTDVRLPQNEAPNK
jgi:hypothetical protein